MPKNSLINLVIQASSNNVYCITPQPGCSQTSKASNESTNSPKSYTSNDVLTTSTSTITTLKPRFRTKILSLIKFCALTDDTDENTEQKIYYPRNIFPTKSPEYSEEILNSTDSTQTTLINIELNSICPEDFKVYNNHCVYVSEYKTNWSNAKLMCEILNARLIIPDSGFKYEKILAEIVNEIKEDLWVYAYYNLYFDDWVHPLVSYNSSSTQPILDEASEQKVSQSLIYMDLVDKKDWYFYSSQKHCKV